MEHYFTKRVLSFADQHLQTPAQRLRTGLKESASADLWGIWEGVFGLAAHQLIVVTVHASMDDGWSPPPGCRIDDQRVLKATARPIGIEPPEKPGVYVFRDFYLAYKDIPEAVELSSAAWRTFEGADAYKAVPMGLFAPAQVLPTDQECQLQLLTWYPDFTAWETSRQFDPDAMKRFMARKALTRSTEAIATRLLLPG